MEFTPHIFIEFWAHFGFFASLKLQKHIQYLISLNNSAYIYCLFIHEILLLVNMIIL